MRCKLQENMILGIPKQTRNVLLRIGFQNIFKQQTVLIYIKLLGESFKCKIYENIKESLVAIKRKMILHKKMMRFQ